MADSRVVNVIRTHRLAMSAKEAETMRELAIRWLEVERALEANMAALAGEIARRELAGETVTTSMMRAMDRYQILKAQAVDEIAKFNADAAGIIADGQATALAQGLQTAQDAIVSSGVFEKSFNKINIDAVNSMIGFAGDGSPLVQLLNQSVSAGVTDAILQSLINGIGMGLGADAIARNIAGALGGNFDRALVIARTEINRSYRSSSVEQYRQSGVVIKFRRLVARDEACPACLALDGEEFDTASEMDDHINGRCSCIPILAGVPEPEWQNGADWFAEQSEAKQREILGAGRFELYQNGMPLQDMAHKVHSDEWGDSPALIPIKDLIK